MLASMYDASLDQFKRHSWDKPSIWPYYSNYSNWNGNYNFSEIESNQKKIDEYNTKKLVKSYDELIGIDRSERRILRNSMSIMADANKNLNEVVITGYETQKRKDLAVALQGKVAGVKIANNNEMDSVIAI